jgi:hypothetical protein
MVTLLWIHDHAEVRARRKVDALARKGSSNSPSIGSELPIPISPSADSLRIKDWLIKMHSERWTATPGIRQSKLFVEESLGKLSRDLWVLKRGKRRLETDF